ncbi:MAG: hypothetical protein WAW39_19105 [Prosthecobacter sp.]|uniref:hypothetical protein n=1 Tax=Prosthecobacter sp. TaxID=1965333 RepID=UPI003BB16BBD
MNNTRSLCKLLVIAALITCQLPALAQDKIEGAFGKKLGEIFNPSSAIGKGELTDGTVMYQFKPEKPFRSLKTYYVLISPTSNQIYSIWGIGSTANAATGKQEQAVLMELLTQKYGSSEKEGITDALYDRKQISQGPRQILTKVTGFSDVTIEIRYTDIELAALAEKERLVIEAGKANGAGL